MEFEDKYFESEVREGFFVTSMMKRSWAAQLEILKDVDQVCRKYGIAYYADAGTLLGAVRHRGYIPWDDDLDICMMRDDYNRFIAVAEEELQKIAGGYFLRNIQTDDSYTELFTRVLNSREISFKSDFLCKYHGCPYGMGIDVFVMDYIPSSAEENEFLYLVIKAIDDLISNALNGALDEKTLAEQIGMIENMLHVQIDGKRPWMNQMLRLEERLFSMYSEQEAEEITMMPIWIKNKEYKWQKSWYAKTESMKFENFMVPVPAMYDAVLWKKFGDYMNNVKSAGMHDYPIFRKQETALKEAVGSNPYVYAYSEQDVKNVRKNTVKVQVKQFLKLIDTIDDKLKHWKEHIQETLHTLEKYQESAISAGTLLEQKVGEGSKTVKSLEYFCELIYRMHEAVTQNQAEQAKELLLLLKNQSEQIKADVKTEIELRYEAVFLPYQADLWEHLESVWKAANEDQECISYVIPIPYFYKKPDGSPGELHDETDQFPDDVPVIRYDAFDFAAHDLDVIYIQNPFDECDTAMSVHPFFYSENLKKYTNQLVYIPPYLVKEITEDDERAISNIRYSCAVPGVIHADKVIVQSENMRQIYIDILTDFSGENMKGQWEEKVLGLGSPKTDQHMQINKKLQYLPKEWTSVIKKPDGNRKKIILYGTDVSALFHYEDEMLQKIKNVLKLFWESRKEIALIWVTNEPKHQIVEKKYEKLWEQYKNLLMEYEKEGWGILETSDRVLQAVQICDGYYGDRGYAAQACMDRKVPVMIQDVKY